MRSVALFGAVLLGLVSTQALACKGPNLQMTDDFSEVDEAWSPFFPALMKIDGGKLSISSDPGKFNAIVYEGSFFPAADVCVDVTTTGPTSRDALSGGAGLAFAITSYSDFFVFMVRPDGTGQISHLTNKGWLNPVPLKKSDAIKTGANAVNTLRVKYNKTGGTAYVNDKPFANFKIIGGADNSKIGFYTESEGGIWGFDNLRISD
jgi:hypothetical protein